MEALRHRTIRGAPLRLAAAGLIVLVAWMLFSGSGTQPAAVPPQTADAADTRPLACAPESPAPWLHLDAYALLSASGAEIEDGHPWNGANVRVRGSSASARVKKGRRGYPYLSLSGAQRSPDGEAADGAWVQLPAGRSLTNGGATFVGLVRLNSNLGWDRVFELRTEGAQAAFEIHRDDATDGMFFVYYRADGDVAARPTFSMPGAAAASAGWQVVAMVVTPEELRGWAMPAGEWTAMTGANGLRMADGEHIATARLGASASVSAGDGPSDLDVREALFFDVALDEAEVVALRDCLLKKWEER
ncbi:unnamed protein product [Pedinophyceae sp. YPF-701]|nr:unnamed protein product [Pedinophyceae sp. YPF-701]